MARIFSHAPSKEYDDGWDAIFGKRKNDHVHELGSCTYCDQRLALEELTRLSQEMGLYDLPAAPEALPEDVADADGSALDADGPSSVASAPVEPHPGYNEQLAEQEANGGKGIHRPRGWTPGNR